MSTRPPGFPLGVAPATVARALDEHPDARAVLVGDPSYVGTVGDVAGLAEAAHAHGVPLVVDAAWAAHFGFHPDLPPHALQAGADAMVVSAHKTLPAWSQAALVLARTARIDAARLDAGVEATATTSPAGAILASTDAARALLERDGEALLGAAISATRAARERLADVAGLVVLDGPGVDPLKLTVVLNGTGVDGLAVEQDLLAAGIPVEAGERDLLIALVSLADTEATLAALTDALVDSIERRRGEPATRRRRGCLRRRPGHRAAAARGVLRRQRGCRRPTTRWDGSAPSWWRRTRPASRSSPRARRSPTARSERCGRRERPASGSPTPRTRRWGRCGWSARDRVSGSRHRVAVGTGAHRADGGGLRPRAAGRPRRARASRP